MATPPFPSDFVTDLSGETAWRFESALGPVATIRAFCCDDPNDGVNPDGKAPVAHIDLSPNPALQGETINYDGSDSYDPDGSVTGYSWLFESHTPASGTAVSGTLNYGTVSGTFTIQLIVTDGTGIKSAPAREELVIEQAAFDVYAATETGVYYGSASGGVTTWTSKNSGLSGDDLKVNDVKIDPVTQGWAEASKVIWRATDGGVQVSRDGGANWAEKNPGTVSNQWSDASAPTPGSLNYQALLWVGNRLFLGATWLNGTDYRSWMFYTDDAPDMRAGTATAVTWTEITTNWEA
jgi:hypothetical protein